jgi:hypothetical protein
MFYPAFIEKGIYGYPKNGNEAVSWHMDHDDRLLDRYDRNRRASLVRLHRTGLICREGTPASSVTSTYRTVSDGGPPIILSSEASPGNPCGME